MLNGLPQRSREVRIFHRFQKAAAQNAVSPVVIKLLEGASTYTNVLIDKLDGIGYEQSILQPLLLCLGYMV
jgi:hypothetical protein